MSTRRRCFLGLLLAVAFVPGCSTSTVEPPTGPSEGGGGTLPAPTAISPNNGEQLSTLRPTLTVQNSSVSAQGTRTYEFQISDRSDFTVSSSVAATFAATVNQTGVPEGAGGQTTFTPIQDLQPATRMYWRARAVQGSTSSPWSQSATFRTKLVGYSRPGELYDPLIHSETIGTLVGAHTWLDNGLRLETQNSYVRYQLAEPIDNGEFSVEVEGLRPNGPNHKLKIFSMSDGTGDITNSNYQMSTMYRGLSGNPDNCIAFKAVFGSQGRIAEPDRAQRDAGIRNLNPASTYFWKATWGTEFRLKVVDGGPNGSTIYELGIPSTGTYRPSPAYAYLGSNQNTFGSDAGTFPGTTYRNLWVGNRPRPETLGNALHSR